VKKKKKKTKTKKKRLREKATLPSPDSLLRLAYVPHGSVTAV
jgi:hypothetical protein